jgi:hypothetical protein
MMTSAVVLAVLTARQRKPSALARQSQIHGWYIRAVADLNFLQQRPTTAIIQDFEHFLERRRAISPKRP